MEYLDGELHLSSDSDDMRVAAIAFLGHSPTQPIMPIDSTSPEGVVDEYATYKVLMGLAKISLGKYGHSYHGLSRHEADDVLRGLSGDVEDFFDPILGRSIQ